jgi:DNA repair exonuclease SbcCD ATPase subunit
MARPLSNSESHRNGSNGDLEARIRRLESGPHAAVNRQAPSPVYDSGNGPELATMNETYGLIDPQDELVILRDENGQLRALVSELQHHLENLTGPNSTDAKLAEQNKEMEALLEEKSELIRTMHLKIQEIEEELSKKPVPIAATPHEEELMRMNDQLERERRQLQEDEESMMQQMRDMEIQMAKERAEIARQRNEMQRLHGEIRHELELAARDATLRERLAPLQRRHQDVMTRRGSSPAPGAAPASPNAVAPTPAAEAAPPKKDSGLLRRLFR